MSCHAIFQFMDGEPNPFYVWKHLDGHPKGALRKLKQMVDICGVKSKAGQLAAAFIGQHMVDDVERISLIRSGDEDFDVAHYLYIVQEKEGEIFVQIFDRYNEKRRFELKDTGFLSEMLERHQNTYAGMI